MTTTNNTNEENSSNDIQFETLPIVSSSFTSQRGVPFYLDDGIPKTSVYNITLNLPPNLRDDVTILNAQLWKSSDNTYEPTKKSWNPRSDGASVDHESRTATLKKVKFLEASYTAQHCHFCIVLFDQTQDPPKPVCRTSPFKVLARKPQKTQKNSPATDKIQNNTHSKAARMGANGSASNSPPISAGTMMSLLSSDSAQLPALNTSGTSDGAVASTNNVMLDGNINTQNNSGDIVQPKPTHPSHNDRPPFIRPIPNDKNSEFIHHKQSKFTPRKKQISSIAT
eukprot:gb/GECH01014442.1/.p1 GENE.gb/GECH01014442.1/~~gb/GECH01014442.1/.p1  ORF type:complete len:282 (+),score=49.41 gb/GECH01014442.1/:1-846(+)